MELIDQFGRKMDYLRISLTDRCNLRCKYCMPEKCPTFLPKEEILTIEELIRISHIFSDLGVKTFKITGGEPFIRKGFMQLIRELKQNNQVNQVTITTNAVTLDRHIVELDKLGINGLNISLDTLNPQTFTDLTGSKAHQKVIDNLHQSIASRIPVKINCLPLKDINEQELDQIALLAQNQVKAVRFIELMPIGMGESFKGIPTQQLIDRFSQQFGPLTPFDGKLGNGPATYHNVPDFNGKLGFINSVTQSFCQGCNRLRLTSEGFLKLCLAFEDGIDLKKLMRQGDSDQEIAQQIVDAVYRKPREHDFNEQIRQHKRGMFRVGG